MKEQSALLIVNRLLKKVRSYFKTVQDFSNYSDNLNVYKKPPH